MISRRNLLGAAAAGSAVAAASAFDFASATAPSVLPAPAKSGIDHIVVVMMENRSFDHFLGWLPGSAGKQAGLTYTDRYGRKRSTHHLTVTQSCQFSDPDHSYEGGREELDFGKCDGWLRAGNNDALAIGYYTKPDLAFLGKAAPYWTTCDHYFAAVMAETYPNRFYQHSAQTDRLHNNSNISTLTTIWDRCQASGVDARYYYGDVPFTALWGGKYLGISQPFTSFQLACATGTLPQVSFVDPTFLGESNGTSGDDHPTADIRVGEHFLSQVYKAVTTSPQWKNTMLIINFDEWGGFFDHITPTRAPDVSPTTALRGFRVPALVISPKARRNFVAPWTYDHTSVLRAIEWRFGLKPLTPRDAHARNIAEVLHFNSTNLTAPVIDAPAVVPAPCNNAARADEAEEEWGPLRDLARKEGFPLA